MLNIKGREQVSEDLSRKIEELEGELEDAREVIRILWGWHEESERLINSTQYMEPVVKYLH
jgi:hypothetical protein